MPAAPSHNDVTPQKWAVAHVITQLELGGAQRTCMTQLNRTRWGHGAKYLVCGSGGPLWQEARDMAAFTLLEVPALVRAIRPVQDAWALAQLTHQLRKVRRAHPGRRLLVHTHSSKAGILGRLAARAAGASCVVHTVHGFGHQPQMPGGHFAALAWAERQVARWTDGFVWVAEANLQRARAEGIARKAALHRLVRAGVATAAFAAPTDPTALNAELGITPTTPVVLSVACLKPQKDPLTLVATAARVLRDRPDAVFLLAGDGELRGQVQARAQALGLGRSFRLLGWRHDVAALMQRADLLLHTSLWEGLPQVFVQAMAAGLPVVATHVDGAAEAVEDGVTGLLCGPGDVAGLTRATAALLAAPGVAAAMGARGRVGARAFDEKPMLAALDAFYAELVGRLA